MFLRLDSVSFPSASSAQLHFTVMVKGDAGLTQATSFVAPTDREEGVSLLDSVGTVFRTGFTPYDAPTPTPDTSKQSSE